MKIMCVDDEQHVLELTVSLCRELPRITEVNGFTKAGDALSWLNGHTTDIALLDINMPDMDGIRLATEIRERYPDVAILFLTGHAQYAIDAFRLHASGYLLKPVNKERLADEVEYALLGRREQKRSAHIVVQTFGEFDLWVDGVLVNFSRARAKELLAYLVDRRGNSITRANAFAMLWEDTLYDRSMQKQLDVVIRSMRATLKEYGIEEIFEMQSGAMRICPEKLDCDLYRFMDGNKDAVNAYRGEYMNAYSWASLTEAYVDRINKHL